MKIRNIFILTALILAVFILGACGILEGNNKQGVININFGDSGGRYAVSDDDKVEMIYKITLTSPGKSDITKTTKKGAESISIPVSEGIWNVKVEAEGEGKRIVKGEGERANVVVAAGIPVRADIDMKITGTRAHNWKDLKEDCEETDDNLSNEYSIEIVSETGIIDVGPDDYITMKNGKTITLWSEKPVTIKRTNREVRYQQTVFFIKTGILILDGTKGEITFQGNGKNNTNCERALINVDAKDGVLEMLEGVTLTDNHTTYGGGVYVNYGGTFKMKGGVISGNYAQQGGGVYIGEGTFTKTGGFVYGEGAGNNSNSASSSSNGYAVYDKGTPYNSTLDSTPDGNWPRP